MKWRTSPPITAVGAGLANIRDEPGASRRRSLAMTAALAAVMVGLAGATLWGNIRTTRATVTQSHALAIDALFSEARNAVTLEEMHARQYLLEPSGAGRRRYARAAASADTALARAVDQATGLAKDDAVRLQAKQREYRLAADHLIELVTDRDPRSVELDRLEVAPAYYTLQQDIDTVSRAYHSESQRLIADLRDGQRRIFATTALGFVLGLTLVAMIWRVVLGYQRRLYFQAMASHHLALHDPLTGLPNRSLFQQRLEAALGGSRPGDADLAVMVIDLNGFKGVNDTLGHPAGDGLLVEVAHRLREVLRDGDTVARLGGDEFAVLLPSVAHVETAREIAERVGGALRRNFLLPAGSAAVSGSVGLALRHGTSEGDSNASAEELLRHADAAMYRAKTSGQGIAVYDPEVDTDRPDRMALFGDLRALLDAGDPDGQLVLYYQPQVRIDDGTVSAAEALVRWRHPELGLLMPAQFLAVAETGGLEIPLTYHLLRTAVAQAARWVDAGRPLVVAVNVSPNCLLDESFVGNVRSALRDFRLPASLLRVELTENSMMTDPDRALAVLGVVQRDGVQVSIDDFGTGFSSLNQLKRLTADELKIDRTFIRDLATDPGDAVLVRSAIDLAHNLGLTVTAEGVEDLTALAMLRELGCDHAQGFALGRPVPADRLWATNAEAEAQARAALRIGPLRASR
jgi:diguanylate cyclase